MPDDRETLAGQGVGDREWVTAARAEPVLKNGDGEGLERRSTGGKGEEKGDAVAALDLGLAIGKFDPPRGSRLCRQKVRRLEMARGRRRRGASWATPRLKSMLPGRAAAPSGSRRIDRSAEEAVELGAPGVDAVDLDNRHLALLENGASDRRHLGGVFAGLVGGGGKDVVDVQAARFHQRGDGGEGASGTRQPRLGGALESRSEIGGELKAGAIVDLDFPLEIDSVVARLLEVFAELRADMNCLTVFAVVDLGAELFAAIEVDDVGGALQRLELESSIPPYPRAGK